MGGVGVLVCVDGGHQVQKDFSGRFQTDFSGRPTRQRRRPPNSERVVDSEQNSEDALYTRQRRHPPKTTRGSSITSRILRTLHTPALPPAEIHESVVDSNCEDAPRASTATRRKPGEGLQFLKKILRTPHASALPPAQNHEKVVDYEQNSEDAPHASAATRPKPRILLLKSIRMHEFPLNPQCAKGSSCCRISQNAGYAH